LCAYCVTINCFYSVIPFFDINKTPEKSGVFEKSILYDYLLHNIQARKIKACDHFCVTFV